MIDLKMLVHAPAGFGKTHLIGTAGKDARCLPGLLVDFEAGWRTIQSVCESIPLDALATYTPSATKLTRVRLTHWRDLDEVYDVISRPQPPYKFVAFDSLTEIHYLALDAVLQEGLSRKENKDRDLVDQRDYGTALSRMRKLIRYARDLEGIHTLWTATTMDREDARTRRGLAGPNLFGKFSAEVTALVDYVSYLGLKGDDDKAVRVLCSAASNRYVAKARNDPDDPDHALPEFIEEPTLTKILDAICGPIS